MTHEMKGAFGNVTTTTLRAFLRRILFSRSSARPCIGVPVPPFRLISEKIRWTRPPGETRVAVRDIGPDPDALSRGNRAKVIVARGPTRLEAIVFPRSNSWGIEIFFPVPPVRFPVEHSPSKYATRIKFPKTRQEAIAIAAVHLAEFLLKGGRHDTV